MRLYNTLTRREEDFAPSRDNQVRMYSCGLTVYARGHIGNFRTFVAVDVLRRALKYQEGFDMLHVMNFTDVDDRTILESNKAGVPLREYTDRFIAAYREDSAALGIEAPEHQPRATDDENIRAMTDTISALEQRRHTYQSDGSVYFKISTFPEYGRLARLDHTGIKSGARVDSDKYEKDDARDFVLWKASKPGEPAWTPSFGAGRPGWHIECSAMALRLLGSPIDLHAGGVDLIFPHHENEIAQAEGATKQTFSRFWVHVEHLFVENEKMSKSIGNVYTVPDVVAKGYRPSALRYLLLSSHYRKQLNFTWAGVEQAEESLRRIVDFLAKLDDMTSATGAGDVRNAELDAAVGRARDAFRDALSSDLNTAAGLAAVFDLVREGNSAIAAKKMSAADARVVREAIEDFDRVLGVITLRRAEDATPDVPVNEIEQLIEERRTAKQRREFARADEIRQALADRGILLEDTPAGTRWKKK